MMINMSKEILVHTYQKHNIKKSDIELSLSKGIRKILNGCKDRKVIYTVDYMAIIIDAKNNLVSAYRSDERQFRIKSQKSKIGGKKLSPTMYEYVK